MYGEALMGEEGFEGEPEGKPQKLMGEFFAILHLKCGKEVIEQIDTITVTNAVHLARELLDKTKLQVLYADLFYQPNFGDRRKLANLLK